MRYEPSPEALQAIKDFNEGMKRAKEVTFTYVGGSKDGQTYTVKCYEGFSILHRNGELYRTRGEKLVYEKTFDDLRR